MEPFATPPLAVTIVLVPVAISFLFFGRAIIRFNVVRFVLISIVKKINGIQFRWDFFRVTFLQIGECAVKMIRISRLRCGIFHWLRVATFHLFQFGEFVFLRDFVMLFTWNDVERVPNITLLVTFTTTTAYYRLLE